jgi:transcriptional regulator with GAF, ATPase, and Fis domain
MTDSRPEGSDEGLAGLRRRYDRLRRSVMLFRDLVAMTDPTAVMRTMLEGIAAEFPIHAAFVGRVHPRQRDVEIVARYVEPGVNPLTDVASEHPLIARLLKSPHGNLLLSSAEQVGRVGFFHAGSRSLLGVRFVLEPETTEVLLLESSEPSAFTGDDLWFVQDLLKTLEATFPDTWARSRADRGIDLLMEVTRGPGDMFGDLDEAEMSRLLQKILEVALSITRCRTGAVLLTDEESGELVVEAETFSIDLREGVPKRIKKRADRPSGIVFRVLEDNRTYLANHVQRDLHYTPVSAETRAGLAIPISFQDRCIGVILVESPREAHFTPDHQRLLENLGSTAASFVRRAQLYQATREARGHGVMIKGRGPAWDEVERRIERASATGATVCLRGESGTGKELVAHSIHFNSARSKQPFVVVNCAAIPTELLESELFGHVKGAFTGAVSDRAGRFETADGGTIFLDEIGDLPPQLQVKLLRVLESGEIRKVGSDRARVVDVRVIAATSRDLETMMGRSLFREDLYYRLMVVPMWLPPLREFPGSIPSMVKQFVMDANIAYGRSVIGVGDDVARALGKHGFPGNVRELRNIIEQAVLMASDSRIGMRDLPAYLRGEVPPPPMPGSLDPASGSAFAPSLPSVPQLRRPSVTPLSGAEVTLDGADWDYKGLKEEVLRRFEDRYLDALLGATGGNVTKAAELAGVHRVNIHRMIKKREEARERGDK